MMGAARVVLPPGSFLQATGKGEETLGALVVEHCRGAKNVVDLFCGVGPFALRLAQKTRVQAFDSEAPAIEALRKAAANTKGLRSVQAQARDLFRRPLYPMELSECDALVFDPPRQGAEAQAKQLAQTKVPRIVAVSCNPSTFVRDARLLLDGGYKLARLTPVDQFRHTPHLELVALFSTDNRPELLRAVALHALTPHVFADGAGHARRTGGGGTNARHRLTPRHL